MQFADERSKAAAYLILRHLYDGDVIEWPIADDHPTREIFAQLEAQGYVARWDRVWPLHDRYRLTERGIAAIEAVYRPAGAEAFFTELRQRNLRPVDRRAYLASRGLDPGLWPLLHDPSTHWSTFYSHGARYHAYVWEDHQPQKRFRPSKMKAMRMGSHGTGHYTRDDLPYRDPDAPHPVAIAQLVDLDRQANDAGGGEVAPRALDYDVS